MKLLRIEAANSKAGLKRIEKEFRQDAFILSNTRSNGSNVILIATDSPVPDAHPVAEPAVGFAAVLQQQEEHLLAAEAESVEPAPDPLPAAPKAPAQTMEPPAQAPGDAHAMRDLAGLIRQEFDAMKLDLLRLRAPEPDSAAQAAWDQSLLALADRGMPSALLTLLRQRHGPADPLEAVIETLRTALQPHWPQRAQVETRPQVHVLVGNHGAGKTLSAIRLAVWLHAHSGKPAVVVSYQDDKEGAWSQVQLLGAKAAVDVYRANRPDELQAILLEHQGMAPVVIDAPANGSERLAALRTLLPQAHFHLVAPVDAYHTGLRRFVSEPGARIDSVLITRMDAEPPGWPLLRLLTDHQLPILLGSASADARQGLRDVDPATLLEQLLAQVRQELPLSHTDLLEPVHERNLGLSP